MTSPMVLHGLGITNNEDSIQLTCLGEHNDAFNFCIRTIGFHSIRVTQPAFPKKRLRDAQTKNYWYQYDSQNNFIYFNYSKCFEDRSYRFSEFENSFINALSKQKPGKLVIDLRANGGGSETLIFPLIKDLQRAYAANKFKTYVLIGCKTFSSGVLNVLGLQRAVPVTTIGETTGGNVNHYGEIREFELPGSKLQVSYSTKNFIRDQSVRGGLMPDIKVPVTFSDFISGTDAALDYAIQH